MLYEFNKTNFTYEPTSLANIVFKRVLLFILIFGTIIGICSFNYIRSNKNEVIYSTEVIDVITKNSFSIERLKLEIYRSGFKFPDIVYAQAIIESSHFKSPVYKENNNIFGMKEARSRLTLAIGTNLNHAQYNNWIDAVKDRLIYEALYLNDLNRSEYLTYLDKTYARAESETYYSDLIKSVIKKYNIK